MSSHARLKHESVMEQKAARDESDTLDLLEAHVSGFIDLSQPTPYPGGTREKRAVMAARYRLGEPMFVKGDSRDWSRYRRDA